MVFVSWECEFPEIQDFRGSRESNKKLLIVACVDSQTLVGSEGLNESFMHSQ